ncbi:MAG: iron-sulfur cluster assembly protein [Nitrososphaerota archaeon]
MPSLERPSEEKILQALKMCYDPEIPVNIVDLGLIYDLQIRDDNSVYIKMTLTAPGCPVGFFLVEQVKEAVKTMCPAISRVDVDLVFDPPWTPDRMTDEAKEILGVL